MKSQVPYSLCRVRSLSIDFKFSGLPTSRPVEISKSRYADNDKMTVSSNLYVEDDLERLDVSTMDQMNEDSPYSRKPISLEERPSEGDGDLGSSAAPLPMSFPSDSEHRWTDTSSYSAKKKLHAWCQLPNGNWLLGNILSSSGTELVISILGGKVLKVNSESLVPANPPILDGVEDLMQLSYLNEPSVLFNLEFRYSQDTIYSKAGPVLVAINPFKEVPLYGNDYIEGYRRKSMESPHVYAIADTAIREMIRGKTETAKIAMQYLAALGGGSGIEYEILKTNPILEAFGNAKTLKNDNSSRFVRRISLPDLSISLLVACLLQSQELSNVLRVRDHITSFIRFVLELLQHLEEALDIVHVSKEDQENAFAMLSAVLWMGDISYTSVDAENHVEAVVDEALENVAKLIGCDTGELQLALSTRKMKVGNDHIVQKLTLSQQTFLQRNSFEQFCINYANERLQQHFNRHLFKLEQENRSQGISGG
ncbi:hypothetical protein ACLOJK_017095 [Asimina triloba]